MGATHLNARGADVTFWQARLMANKWADMSNYLVHFTRPAPKPDGAGQQTAYDGQMGILAGRRIQARTPFGCANKLKWIKDSQRAVCFSEVPAGEWQRLVNRRSRYGIAFDKGFVTENGGGRVWYLDRNTPLHDGFHAMRKSADKTDPEQPFWKVTPFVDYVDPRRYSFEWEREWRVVGDLAFDTTDVAFLFVPEELHNQARAFLYDGGGGAGPAYQCPIVDPSWPKDKLDEALG